jgi:uncharacterized membrane protein
MLVAWGLFAPLLLWQIWRAEWRLLVANGLKHVFAITVLLLAGLWWAKAEALGGLSVHFLVLSSVVLVFGWQFAMIAGALAMLLLAARGVVDWQSVAINAWVAVVFPVFCAHWLHAWVYRWCPKHYFVYLLVSAHFGAMLVIGATLLLGAALVWASGGVSWAQLSYNYLPFIPLVMLAEGFINAMVMTALTAFKPHWVRSFDDRDYLDR